MQKITLKSGVLGKVLGFSMASWVGAIISFFTLPFITRLFSPLELGKINMFQTFYTLIMYISILGLNQGYIRFYKEPIGNLNRDRLFKLCLNIALLFTCVISLIILLTSDFFSYQITGKPGFVIPVCLAVVLLANTLLAMTNTDNRMENNVVGFSVQAITINLAGSTSFLVAAFWSPTHQLAILIMTISFALIAIIFTLKKKKIFTTKIGTISKQEISILLVFSIPMVPVLFLSYLNTALPKFVLIKYLGFETIGIYSAAISIVMIITLLQSGFNIFWTPFVYENYKKNLEQLKKVHVLITYGIVLFALIILLFQDLIYLLLGSNYRDSQYFFAFLLMSPIAYTISETTGIGINIAKKSYLNIIVASITFSSNLLLCLALIPSYGLLGASIAVAVSSLIMLTTKTCIGQKHFKITRSLWVTYFAPLLFFLIAYLNYILFNQLLLKYTLIIIGIIMLNFVYKNELKYILKFVKQGLFKRDS